MRRGGGEAAALNTATKQQYNQVGAGVGGLSHVETGSYDTAVASEHQLTFSKNMQMAQLGNHPDNLNKGIAIKKRSGFETETQA